MQTAGDLDSARVHEGGNDARDECPYGRAQPSDVEASLR